MAVPEKPAVAAWEQIYDSYFSLLFRYSLRFSSDRDMIKDLLQDLFLDLYTKPDLADRVGNMRSYLLVCVRRLLLKRLGQEAKRRLVPFSDENHDFQLELSAESMRIAGEVSQARAHYLQQALGALSRRQKEAIYLRFYENMTYREIAHILGMKEVKYARTLVYRAISEMKAVLRQSGSPMCLTLLFRNASRAWYQ